jgi:hypothetical protein
MAFGVKMTVKNLFFDRATVVREVGKINAKALSKAGAFVRRRARSSMKRRKAPSAPGSPPSAHSKGSVATFKNILFAYEPQNMGVVIGPVLLNGKKGSAPALHEFGGSFTRTDKQRRALAARARKLFREGRDASGKFLKRGAKLVQARDIKATINYPPRPFMGPALAAEAPNFPTLWASSARAAA